MTEKTFTIDFDDPKEIKILIGKLKSRRNKLLEGKGYNGKIFNGNKTHVDLVLPVFEGILNTDISHLYENTTTQKHFYVYFHCNPSQKLNIANLKHLFLAMRFPNLKFEPFYVGKGYDNRYLNFNRNDSHRKIRQKILAKGLEIVPAKIADKLTEIEAFSLESKLIDILGIKSYSEHGMLVNLDEGVNANNRRKLYPKNEGYRNILKLNGFIMEN